MPGEFVYNKAFVWLDKQTNKKTKHHLRQNQTFLKHPFSKNIHFSHKPQLLWDTCE